MAIATKKQPPKQSVVPDKLHKSSGSAVSAVQDFNVELDPEGTNVWFVAILSHQKYTTDCCRFIENAFHNQDCRCYVPSKEEVHRYPNRTKRKVRKFVIPRMIFVTGLNEEQAYNFIPLWPHVDMFLPDRAKNRTHGHVALAQIAQKELVRLQAAIQGVASADDVSFTTENLTLEDKIEVVNGNLKGFFGNYYHDEGKDYLVFALGRLGNIKVKVSLEDCALLK